MNENKEQEAYRRSFYSYIRNYNINNSELSMEELITRIDELSENINPYSVSKEIEEIKSLFYSKLKTEQKEERTQIADEIVDVVELSENQYRSKKTITSTRSKIQTILW